MLQLRVLLLHYTDTKGNDMVKTQEEMTTTTAEKKIMTVLLEKYEYRVAYEMCRKYAVEITGDEKRFLKM